MYFSYTVASHCTMYSSCIIYKVSRRWYYMCFILGKKDLFIKKSNKPISVFSISAFSWSNRCFWLFPFDPAHANLDWSANSQCIIQMWPLIVVSFFSKYFFCNLPNHLSHVVFCIVRSADVMDMKSITMYTKQKGGMTGNVPRLKSFTDICMHFAYWMFPG